MKDFLHMWAKYFITFVVQTFKTFDCIPVDVCRCLGEWVVDFFVLKPDCFHERMPKE